MENPQDQNSIPNEGADELNEGAGAPAPDQVAGDTAAEDKKAAKGKSTSATKKPAKTSTSTPGAEAKKEAKRSGYFATGLVRHKGKTYGPGADAGRRLPSDVDEVTFERWKARGLIEPE